MVAHGGTSVAGSFIQTLTMVDIATGRAQGALCLSKLRRIGPFAIRPFKEVRDTI